MDANFKEGQLEQMTPGQAATVVAYVLPNHVFRGHVHNHRPRHRRDLQRIPPENATGNFTKIVQRVPVRIKLDDDPMVRGSARWGLSDHGRRGHAIVFRGRTMTACGPSPLHGRGLRNTNWVWSLGPFVVMCVGMFIALLDVQIVASSLQDIGGGLSAAQDQISWVQTAYLIGDDHDPTVGLADPRVSTRWLFTASAVGFTVASLLCGLAWNIESMIVFRALQGLLGASMIPTVFTSTFHYFQGPRRVYSAAVVGAIASVAPTLGPVIGGWVTDTLDWRWLFYVDLVPGARCLPSCRFWSRLISRISRSSRERITLASS